jgi:hypothetical protein
MAFVAPRNGAFKSETDNAKKASISAILISGSQNRPAFATACWCTRMQ